MAALLLIYSILTGFLNTVTNPPASIDAVFMISDVAFMVPFATIEISFFPLPPAAVCRVYNLH